jgi:hypothetical protein
MAENIELYGGARPRSAVRWVLEKVGASRVMTEVLPGVAG